MKNHLNLSGSTIPSIFLSHDSKDADIVKAFSELIRSTSAGILKPFYSTDKSEKGGIPFGNQWYDTITKELNNTSIMIALLTEHSLKNHWILYESGYARGKTDCPVIGVTLGIELAETKHGPFAHFQNSDDSEESLLKLIRELIKKVPNASPEDSTIRKSVKEFIKKKEKILSTRATEITNKSELQKGNINQLSTLSDSVLQYQHIRDINQLTEETISCLQNHQYASLLRNQLEELFSETKTQITKLKSGKFTTSFWDCSILTLMVKEMKKGVEMLGLTYWENDMDWWESDDAKNFLSANNYAIKNKKCQITRIFVYEQNSDQLEEEIQKHLQLNVNVFTLNKSKIPSNQAVSASAVIGNIFCYSSVIKTTERWDRNEFSFASEDIVQMNQRLKSILSISKKSSIN